MEEISYSEIKSYFENLANQAIFINDFVGFSQQEWANRTGSVKGLKSPTLALFKYELGYEGPEQNTLAIRKVGFAVLFNSIKPDDLEGQDNAINEAEKIAGKILARIRYDNFIPDHLLYNAFLKDSVEINIVELSGGEYGVDVLFSLKNKQNLKVNADDWNDMDFV